MMKCKNTKKILLELKEKGIFQIDDYDTSKDIEAIIDMISLNYPYALTTQRAMKNPKKKKIPTVSNIELNKKQYIEQLVPVKINHTSDSLTITSYVKWEVPEHDEETTISFSIAIPYMIQINGKNIKESTN